MLNVVVQTSITEMMQLLQMHHVVDDVIYVLPDNGTRRENFHNVLSPALCELDRVCYTIPYSHIGLMNNICDYCAAKKFSKESQGLCCKKGAINLPQVNRLPDDLYNLYENNPHFKDQVRKYNSAFAFTSLGVNVDTQLENNNHGIYTFRIQGQLVNSNE
ncbi:hypothetical protein ROZALSC1DRAFT_23452 [Rozella allomycis CSF55]|uniref:Helitron helicase-like domain-containing protein n=1 Tax=Rozella allomycis (strain CSF55) TaxID=988480 RepID=A0A4P9YFG3_ROZAC|nr:hypothetical protein ROZALSC1DRAFT_23452 [Rozella allomycis CSF55]